MNNFGEVIVRILLIHSLKNWVFEYRTLSFFLALNVACSPDQSLLTAAG